MVMQPSWALQRSTGRYLSSTGAIAVLAFVLGACSSPQATTTSSAVAPSRPSAASASAPSHAPTPTPLAEDLVPRNSVVGLDAETGEVVATVRTGGDPLLLAVAGGHVWTLDPEDGALTRIDPVSRQPATVRLDGDAVGMGSDGANLWVASNDRFLVGLDGATGSQKASLQLADTPIFRLRDAGFLAVADGTAWMTVPVVGRASEPQTLWKIDTDSGLVAERYPIGKDPLTPLVAEGAVWVPILFDSALMRLDLATGRQSTIEFDDFPIGVTAGAGSIWVALERSHSVARLSPADAALIATIKVGWATRGVAVGGGSAWAATEGGVTEISVATNEVVREIRLVRALRDLGPIGIAYLDGVVWVSVE
jgi:outer membrane protein assembly factor BamB